jgi:hypothetical protein
VAVLLGLVVVLLVGEVSLRLLGWSKEYYTFHPEIGYVITPSTRFKKPIGEEGGSRWIASNSNGLRDVEHSYDKPGGVRRILILGDSFCEALQVDLEDTFFRHLQSQLDGLDSTTRFEVINAGVSGYGTDRELLFYRHEGRKYGADIVVLAFVFNDVRNNYRPMQLQMYGDRNEPYFTLENGQLKLQNYPATLTAWARVKGFLRGNLYMYDFVWKLTKGTMLAQRAVGEKSGMPSDYRVFQRHYTPEWESAWAITESLLKELKSETSADGAELFVIGVTNDLQVHPDHRMRMMEEYPAMKAVDWDWLKPNRRMGEICLREGVHYLNLVEPFQRAAEQDPNIRLHSFGGHWTEEGHVLCAELLLAFLADNWGEGLVRAEEL